MVFVNAATGAGKTHLPFGGVKSSCNGSRDPGIAAFDSYTEWKSLYLAPPDAPAPSVPSSRR